MLRPLVNMKRDWAVVHPFELKDTD
jgi:hypothetical protein